MISSETFFALVAAYVTAPMLGADYADLGEFDEATRCHTSGALRRGFLGAHPRLRFWLTYFSAPRVREVAVGYEGRDDERWIHFRPGLGDLDVTDWARELDGRADWNVFTDRTVETEGELERRLQMVGAVMRGALPAELSELLRSSGEGSPQDGSSPITPQGVAPRLHSGRSRPLPSVQTPYGNPSVPGPRLARELAYYRLGSGRAWVHDHHIIQNPPPRPTTSRNQTGSPRLL